MLGDDQIQPLAWALNALATKQKVIAQNMANINTPGYKRQQAEFKQVLAEEVGDEMGTSEPPGADMPPPGPDEDLGVQYSRANWGFDQEWLANKPNPAAIHPHSQPVVPFSVAISTDPGAMRVDGNGVSIEREVGEMNRNVGQYNLMATRISSEFKILTTIIQAR